MTNDEYESLTFDPSKIPAQCLTCGSRQIVLVKILESGNRSKNRTGVCTNPPCHHYTDPGELVTWVRE